VKEPIAKKPVVLSKALQKKITSAINSHKKKLEKELEKRVAERVKEYMSKYLPELENNRKELSKKIGMYDKMINGHKPAFTIDEFKSVLMCLHPDGERTKEKLEEVFKIFKSKEIQLTRR
jgi:hypothetical protein